MLILWFYDVNLGKFQKQLINTEWEKKWFNSIVSTNRFANYIQTRSTTAVDPQHLKVKEDISLAKDYCITISIQKISSIHKMVKM